MVKVVLVWRLKMFDIPALLSTVVDKIFPDANQREAAKIEIKKMEAEGAFKLEELDVKREEIAITDKISARDMQKEALKQDDKFSKRFVYYFSIFWSVISATYIGFITFGHIPPENVRYADTILGFILGTAIASMFQYFLGSTSSSKAKDETIHNMISK